MVSSGLMLTFSAFILCTLINHAWSLECYTCSSLMDDKCGKTWGYGSDDPEAEKLLRTCVGNTVACQKLENKGAMEGHAVSRGCWESDSAQYYTPETECKDMHNGNVCYCRNEDGPCNGKQLLQPQIALILLGLSLLLRRFIL